MTIIADLLFYSLQVYRIAGKTPIVFLVKAFLRGTAIELTPGKRREAALTCAGKPRTVSYLLQFMAF
jgi:hypothetical protein